MKELIERADNAFEFWTTYGANNGPFSKTEVAERFGTSTRSLNRRIDNWVVKLVKRGFTLGEIQHATGESVERINRIIDETVATGEPEWEEYDDPQFVADEEDELNITFTITNNGISIFTADKIYTVNKSDTRFEKMTDLLVNDQLREAVELADIPQAIQDFSEGSIEVSGGQVLYKGVEVKNSMTDRLVNMLEDGVEGVRRFTRFFESLMSVPDQRVVEELYPFLRHMDIEINEDGSFYAYKAVTSDYKDLRTRNMDNSIGASPEMPRWMVDDNKEVTCSAGLHFAAREYAEMFGGIGHTSNRLMRVKVFPCDVVSVPVDYNGQKGRACKYEIVEDVTDTVE